MKSNIREEESPFEFTSKDPAYAANLTEKRITEITQQLVDHKSGATIEELRAMAIYWGQRWSDESESVIQAREAMTMLMVSAKVQEDAIKKISVALEIEGKVAVQIMPEGFVPPGSSQGD